jgi:plastocyanin
MQRLLLALGLVALAVATAACSGATAAPATDGPTAPVGDGPVVVARDLVFVTTEVTIPADEPTTIVLDNQEAAPHNIAIKDGAGSTIFKGEIVSSATVANAVPALAAGSYTFYCEVHPDMTGTLVAE